MEVAALRMEMRAEIKALHQRLRPVELGGVVLVTCASALALESGGGNDPAEIAAVLARRVDH